MCNPRRIRISATRTIAEQWRAEIRRTARVHGHATGTARMSQPLRAMLPDAPRRAFEHIVDRHPRWRRVGEGYVADVPGGRVTYWRDTGELEMVVEISGAVEAEGEGVETIDGTVREEATAEAEGFYYSDGYAGRTLGRARREALRAAEEEAVKNASERARARAEAERDQARHSARAESDALRAARLDAERRLDRERERMRAGLDREAEHALADVHRRTLEVVFATVAEGYRAAVIAYARANGAEDLRESEGDGFTEIQFEMEA